MSLPSELRPPLGLPTGSVRALLTLMIVAVVITDVVRSREIEPLWAETLMIALAHYFTSRRFLQLPVEVLHRLQAEGHIEDESAPLYLPRHSVRVIIVLGFVGLTVLLYREDRLLQQQPLSILGVVFAYLFGAMVRGLVAWWTKGQTTKAARSWEDAKAVVVLLVLGSTAAAYLLDRSDLVPRQLRNATLGLVLFYFGSR